MLRHLKTYESTLQEFLDKKRKEESRPNYDDYYKMITKGEYDSKSSQIIDISDKDIEELSIILKENGIEKYQSAISPKYWNIHRSASGKTHKRLVYINCQDSRLNDCEIRIKEIPDEWFIVDIRREIFGGYYLCDQLEAVIMLLQHNKIIK